MNEVLGLNEEAWNKWVAYKKQLHKKFVPASMELAKKKLAKFGSLQMQVVDQSIERGWTGLFELPKKQMRGLEDAAKRASNDEQRMASLRIRADKAGFRPPRDGEDAVTYEMLIRRAEDANYWRQREQRA